MKLTNPVSSFGLSNTVTMLTGSMTEKFSGDIITEVKLRICRHCVEEAKGNGVQALQYQHF